MAREAVLTEHEARARLADLEHWSFRANAIHRTYETSGWPTTIMAVNAIAWIAESSNHHPDLAVSWARVTVSLSTHSAGGVTDKDIETAALIESALTWRPDEGDALSGQPTPLVR